jgi:hypothetical protein
MALNFTSPITTPEGIEVSNAYGRVYVTNPAAGTAIGYGFSIFASEAAFNAGSAAIYPTFMKMGGQLDYDYATDSKDILDLAHDASIQLLADQGVTATKNL